MAGRTIAPMLIPVLFWAVVASVLSFTLYTLDKRAAVKGRRRVPESTLLLADALFGYPGGFAAQRILRHKGRKTSYQIRFWLIVVGHFIAYAYLAYRSLSAEG